MVSRTQFRRWPAVVAVVLSVVACGDDDGAGAAADAGMTCNPQVQGGMEACYCVPSGTLGFRRCNTFTTQWSHCMCVERPPPMTCTPGDLVACTCPDGTASQQFCRESNTREPCMCSDDMEMDSGMFDATPTDASSDDAS